MFIILFSCDIIKISNHYEGTFESKVDNKTLASIMIDDMGSMDGLSGSSDDGIEQSQLLDLNADVLGLIALSLKPADVYALSLTCKHFHEVGKVMMGNLMTAQLDRVMVDRTSRLDQTGAPRSFMFPRDVQERASGYDDEGRIQVRNG
jgi:hypothetical protein